MHWQILVLNVFEGLACVTGLIYWHKLKHTYWKYFVVYLAVVFLLEVLGEYLLYGVQDLPAGMKLYRYGAIPVEFLFMYWLFYKYARQQQGGWVWPIVFAIGYLACLLIDISYIEGKTKIVFDSFSYSIGNIFLLLLVLQFFIRFVKSDELLHYRESNMFWVSLGILFFYVGSLPFYGIRNTLYHQYRDFFYVYWYIQYCLNYLMYTCFAISFIWGRPK